MLSKVFPLSCKNSRAASRVIPAPNDADPSLFNRWMLNSSIIIGVPSVQMIPVDPWHLPIGFKLEWEIFACFMSSWSSAVVLGIAKLVAGLQIVAFWKEVYQNAELLLPWTQYNKVRKRKRRILSLLTQFSQTELLSKLIRPLHSNKWEQIRKLLLYLHFVNRRPLKSYNSYV